MHVIKEEGAIPQRERGREEKYRERERGRAREKRRAPIYFLIYS